ncbi:hypothetical protein DERP_009295 [Dermatophagoides pteronyssinus]|uniref:Transmembrane protein n=1 Tax=Dermatophagoides pteronyssinus TaxID=6956 RepID=A0ABQ8ITF6_DERPT|nr:hypothetical protein DERP_009295 [Dermatophagoides pteronyssinus]
MDEMNAIRSIGDFSVVSNIFQFALLFWLFQQIFKSGCLESQQITWPITINDNDHHQQRQQNHNRLWSIINLYDICQSST